MFGAALWFLGTLIQLFQGNLPSGDRGNTRVVMEGRVTMHTIITMLVFVPYLFGAFGTHKMVFGIDVVCTCTIVQYRYIMSGN